MNIAADPSGNVNNPTKRPFILPGAVSVGFPFMMYAIVSV